MDKLGTMKKCPKCDGFRFDVKFIKANTVGRIDGTFDTMEDEYMKVECVRCGYIAKELPLDFDKEKEEIKSILNKKDTSTGNSFVELQEEYKNITAMDCLEIGKQIDDKEKIKFSCKKLEELSEEDIIVLTTQCGKTLSQVNTLKECVEEHLKNEIDNLFVKYIRFTDELSSQLSDEHILYFNKNTYTYSMFQMAFKLEKNGLSFAFDNDYSIQSVINNNTIKMIEFIKKEKNNG